MIILRWSVIVIVTALLGACALLYGGKRTHALIPSAGVQEVMVMDFSPPFPLDPPPLGWHHRTFVFSPPMQLSLVTKMTVPALRAATADSASMLFRYVDIPLDDFPILSWRWLVEQPITSEYDETTWKGDDSPARLLLSFETDKGKSRSFEIIWGNRLQSGAVKYIWGFPHYVARGGNENVDRWFEEQLDLRGVFKLFWPDEKPHRLLTIAIFCDSDNTGTASVSYFAQVRLMRNEKD